MPAVSVLPDRPNLEHLKTQAKSLLTAYRADDPEAVERARPYFAADTDFGLNQAQLVIAREYGFESWTLLKTHVELHAADGTANLTVRADNLAAIAAQQRESAEAVRSALTAEPALGAATLAAACVTGNIDAVRKFLAADSANVNAKIAPLDWEPLLYVCYSSLLRDPEYRLLLIETGCFLLENGADPSAYWIESQYPDSQETCLYGATGAHDCPALAEMLLRAGANPDDNEALYHSTELATWDCLKLVLEYGGPIDSTNAVAHLLDREEPEWLRMMLSYAKSPAQIPTVLPFAMRRGRSTECCQILIESGMDINAPDKGQGSRTPYQVATRLGRTDVIALLETAGADTTLSAADALIGRLSLGESVPSSDIPPEIIADLDAETPTPTLVLLAERGQDTALDALLAAGANPDVTDGNGWTGLHHAALMARLSTVRVLLRHNADPKIRDRVHNGPALGFACYSSEHMRSADPEVYVQIVTDLLDAGAEVPETAWGGAEVQALLVARGSSPTPQPPPSSE